MTIKPASDRSLLVAFEPEISARVHGQVLRLYRGLKAAGLPEVINLHPAYCSVLVDFDPLAVTHAALAARIEEVEQAAEAAPVGEPRRVRIPVIYDGPDLDYVAAYHDLSRSRVIELHTSVEYMVYFLGFSPGFAYLGRLPPELATPRLDSPRRLVPAGSVAIGGGQTGVYPLASPGGWRVIGRTDLTLFDAGRQPPALLAMGDVVRFEPAS